MADLVIWHNPRCSKSRQTLALIENSGKSVEIRNYLENPPSATELATVLSKLRMSPRQLLRKGEDAYKTLGLNNQNLTYNALLDAMQNNPKLIERPIVLVSDRAILGRPPENVQELL